MSQKAIFETLPNYEYIRDGFHIVFNGEGLYVTNNADHIVVLEKAKPFVKRIDNGRNEPEVQSDETEVEEKQAEEKEPAEAEKTATDDKYPEHVGGGMYLLSNGEKVKGKKAAEQAESTLEK